MSLLSLSSTINALNTQITITGLLDGVGGFIDVNQGNGETITSVTIKTSHDCTDCDLDNYVNEFAVDPNGDTVNYILSGADLILHSTSFGISTNAGGGTTLPDDVYIIEFIVEVDDGLGGTIEETHRLCLYADLGIKCSLVKAVSKNIEDNKLVMVHNALNNAVACGNCCQVCELFSYLNDLIDNSENCNC